MSVGIVGLGTMGSAIARRISSEHTVYGYDPYVEDVDIDQAQCVDSYETLFENTHTVFILVPTGKPVDDVIDDICQKATQSITIIDGGNSNFHDSLRRYQKVRDAGHAFLDVGISGGEHGEEQGFAVMAGGSSDVFQSVEPVLRSISDGFGYAHVGPDGAGHYVKMIHNGIEYALLQAYAEGFHLLREGRYDNLDLEQISRIWQHGAIVDSFLLRLMHNIMQRGQHFPDVSGCVEQGGTGRWTIEEAFEQGVPVHVIAQSFNVRLNSHKCGGTYATQLIALLRNEFGGHKVYHTD